MAEKPEELETPEDKLQRAKEMFSRGSRNFYVKAYSEAAEDLSRACTIFADIHGPSANECAMPYLIYAKTLIALGTDENKVLDVPDEEDDDEEAGAEGDAGEEGNDDEEGGAEEEEEETVTDAENAEAAGEEKPTNGEAKESETKLTNGDEEEPITNNGNVAANEAQPGTSAEVDEDNDSGSNLEIAWEVLELAAIIFARQGPESFEHLAEALTELASISFENSHFEVAIKDYNKALEVFSKMEKRNNRRVAECHFQVGLCYSMINSFQEAIDQMKVACELLDIEIAAEKAKAEQTEEVVSNITDLEEVKKEITEKIAEINETKKEVSINKKLFNGGSKTLSTNLIFFS